MSLIWIIVETLAVLVENFAYVFFLNSRLKSRYSSFLPQVTVWTVLSIWGLVATFGDFSLLLYDSIACSILLIFAFLVKQGTVVQKILGVVILAALGVGSSVAGAGLASWLTNTSVEHTMIYQDFSRLAAIISIKTVQIIMFYVLAKRHTDIHSLQRKPTLVLIVATVVSLICIFMIFINISEFDIQQNQLLLFLSIGLLFIVIVIFLMYELFVLEERRNIDLSAKLQRVELETHFFTEIDAMYADMRTWRHEYKNNLTAMRALAEHGNTEKILTYIDHIAHEPERGPATLQTGNLVLDAVVSSKLWLAHSRGIEVSIQAVYPQDNPIDDNDLCAITGNLLDNSIEACDRMTDTSEKKFIEFSILIKGKNLIISVINSFNNELKRDGERYLTLKEGPYHGIGISHVDYIVSKYQGRVVRKTKLGVFVTHVMLPLLPLDN